MKRAFYAIAAATLFSVVAGGQVMAQQGDKPAQGSVEPSAKNAGPESTGASQPSGMTKGAPATTGMKDQGTNANVNPSSKEAGSEQGGNEKAGAKR